MAYKSKSEKKTESKTQMLFPETTILAVRKWRGPGIRSKSGSLINNVSLELVDRELSQWDIYIYIIVIIELKAGPRFGRL